jgi:hypothetical protein
MADSVRTRTTRIFEHLNLAGITLSHLSSLIGARNPEYSLRTASELSNRVRSAKIEVDSLIQHFTRQIEQKEERK